MVLLYRQFNRVGIGGYFRRVHGLQLRRAGPVSAGCGRAHRSLFLPCSAGRRFGVRFAYLAILYSRLGLKIVRVLLQVSVWFHRCTGMFPDGIIIFLGEERRLKQKLHSLLMPFISGPKMPVGLVFNGDGIERRYTLSRMTKWYYAIVWSDEFENWCEDNGIWRIINSVAGYLLV